MQSQLQLCSPPLPPVLHPFPSRPVTPTAWCGHTTRRGPSKMTEPGSRIKPLIWASLAACCHQSRIIAELPR